MEASNELCTELAPKYSEFKQMPLKTFKGYKLVCKKNLNYYSIVSGHFRYKPGKIGRSSYSVLYERNKEYYQEHLKNKLAICVNPKDAFDMLSPFKDINPTVNLILLEIELSGSLEEAKAKNKFCDDINVVVGNTIESVREYIM